MTTVGKTSKALYLNGINENVVCSFKDFKSTGLKIGDVARSSRPLLGENDADGRSTSDILHGFVVEAWVRPDCGGVIASKTGLFTLRIGSPKEPAGASFYVTSQDDTGKRYTNSVSTATKTSSTYDGLTFPTNTHASISNDDLSRNTRELIHIAGIFNQNEISILINGERVAHTAWKNATYCNPNSAPFLIGGAGGEYRGHIESVHFRAGGGDASIRPEPFIKQSTTIGLWRFEEEAGVDDTTFYIKSAVSAGHTYITLDTSQIEEMYRIISGKSGTFSGTYSVPSLGSYKVMCNTHSGGAQAIDVAHTGWNLIINPTGTDVLTGKPNRKAPERVRITSLTKGNSRVNVTSTHLDFATSSNTGSRGVFHARTAFDSTNNLAHDSACVLVKSDLLIDAGTDDRVQLHGTGSQAIDTTGIIVRDDSGNGFHGYLYGDKMQINQTDNPFSVATSNWTIDQKFGLGHAGRHKYNSVEGHQFLSILPPAASESLTRNMDGLSDSAQLIFDGNHSGIREQLSVNTEVSLYNTSQPMRANNVQTVSTAKQVIRNGLSSLDPDRDSIIAIGGSGFNIRPFLLKGYPVDNATQNDALYNLHMTPEDQSRVAVLETGDADFPLVEIHYNAIDLTGDTMGTSGPCLLVQKTVPAGGSLINSKRVAATIAGAISAGKKLHAPGGMLFFNMNENQGLPPLLSKSYGLVGDNTGGTHYEVELDKSMIPSNYTPRTATDDPQSPPVGIASAHVETNSHASVYHRMRTVLNSNTPTSPMTDTTLYRRSPVSGNDGETNLRNNMFEFFDIITNYTRGGQIIVVMHPSDKSRSMQLGKFFSSRNDPYLFCLEYLSGRGRLHEITSKDSATGTEIDVAVRGLMDDIASMPAEFIGEGAPDSTVVKELSPDSPVVSVTLGGPGQGAVLTQPTWDKSVLSRLGWSSRRDGGGKVAAINSDNIDIKTPLNNVAGLGPNAGTVEGSYSFPPRGRFYLPSGASVEYFKIVTHKLYFHASTGHLGTGRFVDGDGKEYDSFALWDTATGFNVGDEVVVDAGFTEDSIIPDGTSINDRLFQQLSGVSHDYQLGTQYSSTRAMVEIPVFSNQFFNNPSIGSFPSPDNSMKLHLDATMTAHTWAPNPVGRRPGDFYPQDRDVEGPYHKRIQDNKPVSAVKLGSVQPPTRSYASIQLNAGSATMTSGDYGSGAQGAYVEIKDSQGVIKQYKPYASGTTGDVDDYGFVKFVFADPGNNTWGTAAVTQLMAAIEHENGHNGSFESSQSYPSALSGANFWAINNTIGPDSSKAHLRFVGWSTTINIVRYNSGTAVTTSGVTNGQAYTYFRSTRTRLFIDDVADRFPENTNLDTSTSAGSLDTEDGWSGERMYRGMRGMPVFRRVFRPNGEWALIEDINDVSRDSIDVEQFSSKFFDGLESGTVLSLTPFFDFNGVAMRDDSRGLSTANEFRRPFYYDRSNVQTQGGNIDYGLRQYVSAVEFKAGPTTNPHALRIQNKTGSVILDTSAGGANWIVDSDTLPITKNATTTFTSINTRTGAAVTFTHNHYTAPNTVTVTVGSVAAGDELSITGNTTNATHQLNRTWNYSYAPGGLRHGDTVWMNMHYTNPHAIDGMFCKSRGVFNQYQVWSGFDGGEGTLTNEANSTLPLENFLIGNTCRETAANFAQHVNKTISLNWQQLGYSSSTVPVVAYVDPYLDTDGHARVLLYDVAHDKEFVAFHDLYMQVQTSQDTPQINGLDVAAGFKSQINTSNRSSFTESAYAHQSYYLLNPAGLAQGASPGWQMNRNNTHTHQVTYGSTVIEGATGRLANEAVSVSAAEDRHEETVKTSATVWDANTTMMDTPDGTRAIPAFLCLKGIRGSTHDLSSHSEDRLNSLPHWTDMDFVRRLTVDFGSVAIKDGVSDIMSAAEEIVRQVNQGAALKATSGGGSAHDPAAFWDPTSAATNDRGTHMGYLRAHIGRSVKDLDGNEGFTVVIHSTVPGASGRNFCAWLDNSKGQVPYKPEYLIGHGGRFRNSWCLPQEGEDENMHPAPMPVNKNGRPFAPVTTLRQLVPTDESEDELISNLHFGFDSTVEGDDRDSNTELTTGRAANTVYDESFESQGQTMKLVEGLRTGTRAQARINFGGLVASGVPGWAPDAGKWGCGEDNQSNRFSNIYSSSGPSAYSAYIPSSEKTKVSDRPIYGFKFTDHRGRDYTIRLLYKQAGKEFSGTQTQLPSTLENEILIYFDDRDVAQGGFTLGKHMLGSTHPDRNDFPSQSWKGNLWKGVKSPANGYAASTTKAGDTVTIGDLYHEVPRFVKTNNYFGGGGGEAIDILGFLGFPESGLLTYTDTGNTTTVVRYTSRTTNDHGGPHKFFGVTDSFSPSTWGSAQGTASDPVIISPSLNWTTILTDEVIAAAVELAFNVDPNNATNLDISEMYATDGKSFSEWLGDGAKTAVTVTTLNDKQKVTPLKDLFTVKRRRDLGLYSSCLGDARNGREMLTKDELERGMQKEAGYIPWTLLNVMTNSRGPNSNTATPVLVNSSNNPVDVSDWKGHLTGAKFTSWRGDHILPHIESHTLQIDSQIQSGLNTQSNASTTTVFNNYLTIKTHSGSATYTASDSSSKSFAINSMFLGGPVGRHNVVESSYKSYIEKRAMFINDVDYVYATPIASASDTGFIAYDEASEDFPSAGDSIPLPSYLYNRLHMEFAGVRTQGNVYGEPLTYFRGAQSSPDHSVPLYFGGGFSGLVMDVNDGTQNDYTEFYSHPYTSGPTGCSGLQHAGENMGASAILDTTAMLAMFPGTPLLNQHRGENISPFNNNQAILAPDLKNDASAQTLGISSGDKDAIYEDSNSTDDAVPISHPTPVVLRFAHPYSRYTDASNEVAYVIFGPGQSVPKHFNQYTGAGTVEPASSQTVANKVTHVQRSGSNNTYYSSGTPDGLYLPNQMGRSNTARAGIRRYMPPTLLYQKTHTYPYKVFRNWEPASGAPSSHYNQDTAYDAYAVSSHFYNSSTNAQTDAATAYAHPFCLTSYNWYMDGGFPAGGNWFDYAVRKNPPHPTTTESTKHLPNNKTHSLDSQTITLGLQASMFRVGYVALTTYDSALSETTPPKDVFIVDATRVQNSEELGAVISAAINSYPGEGNLKAIGGTFLPSFQDAIRQDKYSWVDIGNMSTYTTSPARVNATNDLPPSLPASGWLRLKKMSGSADGSNTNSFFGPYSAYTGASGSQPVGSLTIVNGGSGYAAGNILSASSGGFTGSATITVAVASLTKNSNGTYASSDTGGNLSFSAGNATGTYTTADAGAPVASVSISNGGSGYTSAPTVTFSSPQISGSTATGTATIGKAVASLGVSDNGGTDDLTAGSGSLTFSGGGGTGAAGTWTADGSGAPIASATFTNTGTSYPVRGSDGFTANATVTNHGAGSSAAFVWHNGYPLHGSLPLKFTNAANTEAYVYDVSNNQPVSAGTYNWNMTAAAGTITGLTQSTSASGTLTVNSDALVTAQSVTNQGQGFLEDHGSDTGDKFNLTVTPQSGPLVTLALKQRSGSPGGYSYSNFDTEVFTSSTDAGRVRFLQVTNGGSNYAGTTGQIATYPRIGAYKTASVNNTSAPYSSGPIIGTHTAYTLPSNGSTLTLSNGGSGYTSAPSVTINGAGFSGSLTTTLASSGAVKSVAVGGGGAGYTSATVSFSGGGGSSAAGSVSLGTATRTLNALTLTSGGSGYTPGAAPSVTAGSGGGSISATLASTGTIASVAVINGGSYTTPPTVIVGGGGSNANITATLTASSYFTLATNFRGNAAKLDNPMGNSGGSPAISANSLSDTYKILVWSKAGNLRWSNGGPETLHNSSPTSDTNSIYDQLAATQVHFSGLVDAIDRTRPIGAVGWHGERYSKLNSLVVPGTSAISSGLGAWHPALGTNPYGGGMTCHSLNSFAFVSDDDTSYTPTVATGHSPTGLHPRHYVIVSYEGELPIIARADRDGLLLAGDMLDKKWNSGPGGTIVVSHESRHNNDRYVSYAHGGPHVDAQIAEDFTIPASNNANGTWAGNAATTNEMFPMETCLFPTGDLFFDTDENPGVKHYPAETGWAPHNTLAIRALRDHYGNPWDFWDTKSAARNFLSQHIVWKRMDGGNLCMPASNARGLGAVPWVWRKVGGNHVKFGETIYGNNRFSFETTNGSMFPVIQAQELTQPHLAEQFPIDVKNALAIPNEEIQFQAITVTDDAGQEHKVEGGSPFGTIVRDFQSVSEREVKGPSLAGSGNEPPLKIRLPDPDTIPGNLIVRSGFDRIQSYQHESMGTGGLQRPDLPDPLVKDNFDALNTNPETNPFYENRGYERIDTRADEYPFSRTGEIADQSFLETSYEPHDRALYFHLTSKSFSYTEREPLGYSNGALVYNNLVVYSIVGTTVTANVSVNTDIWQAEQLPDGRSFFTVNGHIVSFTGVSGQQFTGCKFSPGFSASADDVIKPSFFVPSGTTRHFAARRLRDHAEVSGESPDKKPIDWMGIATNASPATAIRSDRLTPMPLPRMGHHYVTPTMAMMPGHLAHPLYQRAYNLNRAYHQATTSLEKELGYTKVGYSLTGHNTGTDGTLDKQDGIGLDVLMWFSSTSAPHPPSDIHGGAFTLMTETKMRYDGYGILAYDAENTDGDHRLKLEAGTNYSTHWNFPDPMETGAYQIVIQPNLYSQQLMGFNDNYDFGADSGTKYPILTDAQVATVVALQWNGTAYDFILSHALKADVRGCEVYLNEVMLDIDPSPNQQFANLPPLALYNPLGINENTSPIWSRKSLPYRPGMFQMATPGYTLTVPWWSPALKSSESLVSSSTVSHLTAWTRPEDYYLFSRSGYGSIGSQMVMTGYPSHFLHPYTHSYMSHVAQCKVLSTDSGNNQIVVDNNALFPEVGDRYMGNRIVVTGSDGVQHRASYTHRGVSSGQASQTTNVFYGLTCESAFYTACTAGAVIRLTADHSNYAPGEIFTDKTRSVFAHIVEDLASGSQDTQTGHLPDAYLSMWHYNLGRPMTFYSDSRSNIGDAAVDKKPYNHLPEHFETVRYQNFSYVVSDGPFDFRGYTRGTTTVGSDSASAIISPDSRTNPQARTDSSLNSKKHHYGSFWPGGSRFGAQASDLSLWGTAGPGWSRFWDSPLVYQESGTAGEFGVVARSSITDSISSTNHRRPANFGYRFCIRQAPNRPRWALWATQAFDDKYTVNNHSGYRFGVYVQSDQFTTNIYTSTSATTTATRTAGYTGMLERLTNASALVGSDLKLQQVRYSHGRRITRPFGCPVRNYISWNVDNDSGGVPVVRAHQGDYMANMVDGFGNATLSPKRSLAPALAHYMTDWWGNTTGEDVRRFPVRSFGVRPAWDPEDAYRATDRTISAQTFAAPYGQGLSRANLDAYNPATAKRVGDRGDGRGVRWPTVFNEDVLQDVDIDIVSSGVVLSHATAEPQSGIGYTRPRNDSLQDSEVKRGISRRLDVAATDGLLKPEAMAGANVERAVDDLLPASESLQEPISRIAPRIGLDMNTVGEINDTSSHDYIALASEAHSLHTDRGAGKRYVVAAGIKTDTRAVDDYRLDSLNFSSFKQVMRLNHTHGIWPLGGSLVMDLMNYMEPVSDLGWGTSSGSAKSSNPYQSANHNSMSYQTNEKDRSVKFLLRPVRVLDHRHVEIFRDQTNALSGTAGGRYGVFTYDTPTARATTSSKFLRATNPATTNAPYPPAYFFTSSSHTVPSSVGPRIPGSESSSFSNTLKQTIARVIVSNNTLQHMRGDASRSGDFSVQPRYTQAIYPGDDLNKSDHSGESNRTDNEVNG
jgi:hypothetical protein